MSLFKRLLPLCGLLLIAGCSSSSTSNAARNQGGLHSTHSSDYCYPNSGIKVVDTSLPLTSSFLQRMKEIGVEVVIRYYGYDRNNPPPDGATLTDWDHGKILTTDEIALLKSMGMQSAAVFQYKSHEESTFSNWRTRANMDAQRAISLAKRLGQPKRTPIYFTADADFVNGLSDRRCQATYNARNQRVPGNCTAEIKSYFAKLAPIVQNAGYDVAVYGTGATCKLLTDAGIVNKCWLNFSTGHSGREWGLNSPHTVLRQLTEAKSPEAQQKCGGRAIDANWILQKDFGQFKYR